MIKIMIADLLMFGYVNADEFVNGYYKSDGTYVQPYYRSNKNYTNEDNFSTYGNTNPYTGEKGTKRYDNPYNKSYNNPYSPYGNQSNKRYKGF